VVVIQANGVATYESDDMILGLEEVLVLDASITRDSEPCSVVWDESAGLSRNSRVDAE